MTLINLTDEQLLQRIDGPQPGSQNHESIKFELQRRTLIVQKQAATAAERAAITSEKCTKVTMIFVVVTVLLAVVSDALQLTVR